MTIDRPATRVAVALVALLLAAGTALAADPSASPLASSPSASASVAPSPSPESSETARGTASSKAAEPSEAAEPSDSPEASEAPESPEAAEPPEATGAAPSAAQLARTVDRLKAAGITTTTGDLAALAAKVGLGGAVRVLAFAHASGKTPDQIVAMFQGGMGWGEIDHQLGLSIGPGIGWIMGNGGGHGNGRGHGNGQGPKH